MASERWTPAMHDASVRRHALMDTTDQVTQLRKTLGKQKKAELVEAMVELAKNDRSVLRGLQMRFGDDCSTDQLIRATRQAIVDATKIDESQINYNFNYDSGAYTTIESNFKALADASQFESLMGLSLELMAKGSEQLEMSDEGMMFDEIQDCLIIVIKALPKSAVKPGIVKSWSLEMLRTDRIGCVCDLDLKELAGTLDPKLKVKRKLRVK